MCKIITYICYIIPMEKSSLVLSNLFNRTTLNSSFANNDISNTMDMSK